MATQTAGGRGRYFRALTPVIGVVAGLLAATAIATSHGRELSGQRDNLPQLVAGRQDAVADLDQQAARLRSEVDELSRKSAVDSRAVQQARAAEAKAGQLAGLDPAEGAGVTVALDDAPASARNRPTPAGVPAPSPNDLVVHQQDVQAALNALRAGGAGAITVMGQRVIATTAVRCVGNTLLLNGKVYSPPFVLAAIGDPAKLRSALDAEPGMAIYRQYVDAYGLQLSVTDEDHLRMPGYDGPVGLTYARPLPS